MKIQKLKAALKSLLIEFRSVNTDKAVLSWDGERDLEEGISVYITDEEGNRSIPEDGEYIDEEKTKYVIESGIVKQIIPSEEEIIPEEQPEAPSEEPAVEEPEEPVEEPVEEEPKEDEPAEEEPVEEPAEEPAEEPVEETPVEEVEEVVEEANALAETVNGLVERINALAEEIEQLKAFKAGVEKLTAGKTAQETFREVSIDPNRANNKELSNLQKLFK